MKSSFETGLSGIMVIKNAKRGEESIWPREEKQHRKSAEKS